MRTRIVVSIVSLLLPAALTAQRLPLPIPGTRTKDPREMPRQPEPVARAVEYQRLRISVEGYPAVSYVTSSGFLGGASSWMAFGAGTHGEYRLTPLVAATLDLTSAFSGGPATMSSAELGTRIHRQRSTSPIEPYLDLRVGYVELSDWNTALPPTTPTPRLVYGSGVSNGWGGIVGGGLEYGLTSTMSLATGVVATHSRMTAHQLQSTYPVDSHFTLTAVRWTLGLKYAPIRTVHH